MGLIAAATEFDATPRDVFAPLNMTGLWVVVFLRQLDNQEKSLI